MKLKYIIETDVERLEACIAGLVGQVKSGDLTEEEAFEKIKADIRDLTTTRVSGDD